MYFYTAPFFYWGVGLPTLNTIDCAVSFFQVGHIGGGILTDDAEQDGQVGMVSSQPFLQVAGLADLVKILACL